MQHSPQLQYPVTTTFIVMGLRFAGGVGREWHPGTNQLHAQTKTRKSRFSTEWVIRFLFRKNMTALYWILRHTARQSARRQSCQRVKLVRRVRLGKRVRRVKPVKQGNVDVAPTT